MVEWIIHVCISHQSDQTDWDSIKDQSNCGLYIWIAFMNICFRFKVRPFLFCCRFDLIGPCWSEVSIPSLDFYVALGENIVCGF